MSLIQTQRIGLLKRAPIATAGFEADDLKKLVQSEAGLSKISLADTILTRSLQNPAEFILEKNIAMKNVVTYASANAMTLGGDINTALGGPMDDKLLFDLRRKIATIFTKRTMEAVSALLDDKDSVNKMRGVRNPASLTQAERQQAAQALAQEIAAAQPAPEQEGNQ